MAFPYVSRIEIDGFRNLHGLKADLQPSSVLVGENRSGKTNLLYALRLVLDPSLPDSSRQLRAEDFWDGLPEPFSGHRIVIKTFLAGFEGNTTVEAVLADSLVEHTPPIACLTFEYRPRKGISTANATRTTEADYEYVVYGGADETRGVGRDVRNWLGLTVLPAMRDAEEQIMSSRRSILRPLIDRLRPSIPLTLLGDVRKQLDVAAKALTEEQNVKALQEKINARIKEIVGQHQTVATKFDFAGSDANELLRSLRLFLDDGKLRSVADASLGTANLLFLALLLQDLDDRNASKSSAGTLLGVEEPEAHLHPHVQRLLFRYALRREHSVIVTTHSPHVASVSPLASLMVFRSDKNGNRRLCSAAGVGLSALEVDDLQRYLDVTRAEMLFARGLILVEGMAEQFLIPVFAGHEIERRGLGTSLDEIGITVCSVAGTDFGPYWRVTSEKGWQIPRVVVTDGDPTSSKGKIYLAGLRRGARLLGNAALETEAKEGKEKQVRAVCAAAGIFVGQRTLELDLADVAAVEMNAVFEELVPSPRRRKNFAEALAQVPSGDIKCSDDLIAAIEYVGKGRFAQRLASKITAAHDAPSSVKLAIDHILSLVALA